MLNIPYVESKEWHRAHQNLKLTYKALISTLQKSKLHKTERIWMKNLVSILITKKPSKYQPAVKA
jgi:hypothetical protein